MSYIEQQPGNVPMALALQNGDSMSQEVFHALYEKSREGLRAELLGGTVFIREPLAIPHGSFHGRLSTLFDTYAALTPGVQMSVDATVILGEFDEVQPDLFLRILPECNGQSRDYSYPHTGRPYVKGAPELVAEIAYSSRSIDLHLKRQRYEVAGVMEYMVVCLEPAKIHWFDLRQQTIVEPGSDGIYRSSAFPGLWIHESGLLEMDFKCVMDALHNGLSSSEHRSFAEQIQSAKGSN